MEWTVHTILAGEFGPMPEWMRIRQAGAEPGGIIPSYIYLLTSRNASVLVDTSFSCQQDVLEKMRIYCRREKHLPELLAGYGVSPQQISAVILTHLHWDHAGGFDLFPNANVYCQRNEFEWMIETRSWEIGYPDWFVERLIDKKALLTLMDGDYEASPGIFVRKCGGHTPGSQMVSVETTRGKCVIPGDSVMSYETIEKGIPAGLMCNIHECLAAVKTIQNESDYYLPSHDWKTISRK